MNTVKLKEYTREELKAKILMLRASGKFGEQTLILIERAIANKFAIELEDEQIEVLEALNLVDSVEKEANRVNETEEREEEFKDREDTNGDYNINGARQAESLNRDEVNTYNIDETTAGGLSSEKEQGKDGNELENESETPESAQEIDVTVQIESEEAKIDKEKEEAEKQFVPKSPEDLANIPPEMMGKMFYLTPERLIDSIKRLNGGAVWKTLSMASKDENGLEEAIKKAYESGIYESDLKDPNFLDERVSKYLPEENQAVQLKELHLAALMGTYVGYHVEKVDGDVNNINAQGVENSNIKLKFPMLVSEMPEALKEQSRRDIVRSITRQIEEMSNTSDSRRALRGLNALEDLLDTTIENYSEVLHDTEENKAVKAYIKTIRTDISHEMQNNFDELNISMDFYDVNWNDPAARRTVITMIQAAQEGGQKVEVPKLLEEVNMSFTINSIDDIPMLEAACQDLSLLARQGIEINISFDIQGRGAMDPELNAALNDVLSRYDNISRDFSAEMPSNVINSLSEHATEALEIGMEQDLEEALFNPTFRPPIV